MRELRGPLYNGRQFATVWLGPGGRIWAETLKYDSDLRKFLVWSGEKEEFVEMGHRDVLPRGDNTHHIRFFGE